MKSLIPLIIAALPMAAAAQTPSGQAPAAPPTPKITEVMVMLTTKPGVTRQQVMAVMPAEVRDTVKLYLDGKIRQWYSHDRGVIFFVDAKTKEEAQAIMDTLPLSRENLMDYQYIPVGPLMPLTALIGGARP